MMTTHRDYMRRWQARRRWPYTLARTLAKLERLLKERPEGAELPPLPEAVKAAWPELSTGPHAPIASKYRD